MNFLADERFALMLSYLLRKQLNPFSFIKYILTLLWVLYQSCFNNNSQTFLANSIVQGFLD